MRHPTLLNPDRFDDWAGLLALLNKAFAYMEGRIDPPSSLLQMTEGGICQKALDDDLFIILDTSRPIACLFGHPEGSDYYIGKLAVDHANRGTGLARRLIDAAAQEATRRGLKGMRLQSRVELTDNHRAFRAMGFRLVGASAHPGYARATSLTFHRPPVTSHPFSPV